MQITEKHPQIEIILKHKHMYKVDNILILPLNGTFTKFFFLVLPILKKWTHKLPFFYYYTLGIALSFAQTLESDYNKSLNYHNAEH